MTTSTQAKSATCDGVTLRYIETGTGEPPILFIHGWTCNRTNWRDQIPHFAKKHRVVAVDLRGHGESDKPDQDYTIEGFVDDVAWLIGKLGLERPVVVGHSMGGMIALNLVRRQPKLVSAIVMVDAPIVPFPDATIAIVEQLLAGMRSPAYSAVAMGFARMAFFDASSPPELVEELVAGVGAAPQRLMHTAMASIGAPESKEAGVIPVPALFIRAGTAYATEDEIRTRYPGLGVITVSAAHFVQMEQPAGTNNIISDFLDKLE
jgi:pimeloyl-ACP methyl ester carboxylesterase